jgi:hypothetical protein
MITNWTEVQETYISGDMSLKDLAANSDFSLEQVKSRCSKEEWVEKRKQFRKDTLSNAKRNAKKLQSAFFGKDFISLELLSNLVFERLQERSQECAPLTLNNGSSAESKANENLSAKSIDKELMDIGKLLHVIVQAKVAICGEVSEKAQVKFEIDNVKLDYEKVRLQNEQKKAEELGPQELHIVMSDEIRAWGK